VRGDPLGELFRELPERFSPGDEVGLAVDLDHHRRRRMDVSDDQPLGRRAPRLARRRGQPLLSEDLPRLFDVAAGLDQRLLALHHADAGLGAQVGHHSR
jgi:hypothetical protein